MPHTYTVHDTARGGSLAHPRKLSRARARPRSRLTRGTGVHAPRHEWQHRQRTLGVLGLLGGAGGRGVIAGGRGVIAGGSGSGNGGTGCGGYRAWGTGRGVGCGDRGGGDGDGDGDGDGNGVGSGWRRLG